MVTNVWPLQKDCDSFYGDPRGRLGAYSPAWAARNLVHVPCPWAIHIEHKPVPFITIHRLCADSLKRVLQVVWLKSGGDQQWIHDHGFDIYDGSFNYRPMRDGHALSMHSYGCAIDWDAAANPQHSQKHLFTGQTALVEAFKAEGWVWGGEWSGLSVDAMHVQAARVHP